MKSSIESTMELTMGLKDLIKACDIYRDYLITSESKVSCKFSEDKTSAVKHWISIDESGTKWTYLVSYDIPNDVMITQTSKDGVFVDIDKQKYSDLVNSYNEVMQQINKLQCDIKENNEGYN